MIQSAVVDLSALILKAMRAMLDSGSMEIRDVDHGDEPFGYASGWSGPGYILIKALVSHGFFPGLVMLLAVKVATVAPRTTFIAGNVTGGVIPGWLLSQYLEILLGHPVHFMYVSGTRDLDEAKKRPIMIVDKLVLERVAQEIANAVATHIDKVDFVAGGAPGGMVLAYRISEILSLHFSRHIPFVYVRDIRKSGGHGEMITGIQNNPFFEKGMTALAIGQYPGDKLNDGTKHVMDALEAEGFIAETYHSATDDQQASGFQSDYFLNLQRILKSGDSMLDPKTDEGLIAEELTNFTHSARVSAHIIEEKYGFHVPGATCILSYDQPEANRLLQAEGLDLISLFTLRELLSAARQFGSHPGKLIKGYRTFLADTIGWNQRRGFKKKEEGGTL